MLKLLRALIALLGLALLMANAASALAAAGGEKPASGSAATAETRARENTRLSEEAVRENPRSLYDLTSDSPVAAEGAGAAGEFSLYDSTGGLKGLNTNVTADEFSANLQANGYTATQTTGTNGAVSVLQNGQGSTWTIYTRSSTGDMGAQFIGPNGQFLKYNLGVQGLPLPGP